MSVDKPGTLHAWLDQVEGVVVLLDRRGTVVYANAAMLDLLGWERDDLIGRDWFDTCLPEQVRVPVRGGFAMIIAGELEPMAHYTNEVITKSGEPVAVSWSNSLLREDGRVVGTMSLGQPAGLDTASADALRAARYEQLFDATPVGVLAVTRDGTVQLANAHASLLLHRPVEQLVDVRLGELIASDEACAAILATPLDGRTDLEVPLTLPDGSTTWARCTARTGVDPVSDEPVIRLGLLEAEAERQDREALAQMAHELSARNAELRRFADVLAHDLKGPLQAMVGRLEMLQVRPDLGAQSAKDAEQLLAAAEGLNSVMENVRSTWAAGAEAIGTDADEAFDEAVRQLDLVLSQAGAAVTRGPLPRVGVGHERLVQVFRNLLDNSAKYRGDAPLRIEAVATQSGGMWRITLRDNGVGFASEDAERLFDDGERLDAGAHIGGQGLGLRLCRDLLAVDGGVIHAQGTPGAGAAFTLTLPAA